VYHVIVWNYMQMGEMVKGKKPYDAADYSKRAERIAALSTQLEEGFVPNSAGRDSTEAKAEIWSNWDDFKSKLGDFERESKALAEVAKTGKFDDVKAQHAKVSGTCKACHDKYKAD
jgi:cytochrome c556